MTDRFIHNIGGIMRVAHFERNAVNKKKSLVRKKMGLVLRDIEEDVAYRPGFWGADEAVRSLTDMIFSFSKKIGVE
jgi:hypothetical protein